MKTPQELNELADRLGNLGEDAHGNPKPLSLQDRWDAAHELRHMAQLHADLHEAAELLRDGMPPETFPANGMSYKRAQEWCDHRDSFLDKLKGKS